MRRVGGSPTRDLGCELESCIAGNTGGCGERVPGVLGALLTLFSKGDSWQNRGAWTPKTLVQLNIAKTLYFRDLRC
jgi:hypothetical protein